MTSKTYSPTERRILGAAIATASSSLSDDRGRERPLAATFSIGFLCGFIAAVALIYGVFL